MATMEPGQGTLDGWIKRLEQAIGTKIVGGARVQTREIFKDAFQHGLTWGAWKIADEKPVPEARDGVSDAMKRAEGLSVAREVYEIKEDPTERPVEWSELRGWWEQTAHDEIAGLIGKMEEYGGMHRATDLTEIGRAMVEAGVTPLGGGGGPIEVQEQWYQELGAYFYLRGKFARWGAAIIEGRPVSDDTLHDIAIYTRMVQRIRARGGWPV